MAGASAERQEQAFIKAVQSAVKKNKKGPITVNAGGTQVTNVIDAKKYPSHSSVGSEPYTDVILVCKNQKDYNLSLKGEAAPSLAGGGLRGLEAIIPGLADRFMQAAYDKLISQGLKEGDKIPDVYGAIGNTEKIKIVVGTRAMGGPIDYMYIGPMSVTSDFDDGSKTLTLNGTLTEAKKYAKGHNLYFRLRARREDQRFDPNAKRNNVPKIYGKSPSRGDSAGRIVVTDSVPANALIVEM
jgi:hypothetical protein